MSQHNNLIYLDYAATTPVAKSVAAKMSEYLTVDGIFGNPASRSHGYGWQAEEAVETARGQVAEAINADPREIVFTSGASCLIAIKGMRTVTPLPAGSIPPLARFHFRIQR